MSKTITSQWYHDKLMRDVDDADWLEKDDDQHETLDDIEELEELCTQ